MVVVPELDMYLVRYLLNLFSNTSGMPQLLDKWQYFVVSTMTNADLRKIKVFILIEY